MTAPSDADKIADAVGRGQHGLWLPIWIIDACDGDLNAARMLAQILYWFSPDKHGNSKGGVIRDDRRWIAKRHDEWWDEIRLSEFQAKRAAETLRGLKLVDVDHFRFNGIRTVHYARRSDEIAAAVSAEPNRPKRAEVRLPEGAEVRRPLTEPTAQPTADLCYGATDAPPPSADPAPPELLVNAGPANPNGTATQAELNGTGKPKARKSSAPRIPLGPGSLVYRDAVHLTPNHAQREILDAAHAAHGEAAMRAVMVAWLAHGYSPKNVAGMVDAINAGGLRPNGHNGAGSRANGKPLSAMVLEI